MRRVLTILLVLISALLIFGMVAIAATPSPDKPSEEPTPPTDISEEITKVEDAISEKIESLFFKKSYIQ